MVGGKYTIVDRRSMKVFFRSFVKFVDESQGDDMIGRDCEALDDSWTLMADYITRFEYSKMLI